MSRLKFIVLAGLAALFVSAVGSASASAALPKCDPLFGGDLTWCYEKPGGVLEEIGPSGSPTTETISSTGGASSIKAGITVECAKETDSGILAQDDVDSGVPGVSDVEIIFTGCKVFNNPKCIVHTAGSPAGTIVVGPEIDGEGVEIGGEPYIKFHDSNGANKFVTLLVENKGTEKCLVAGNYEVTGETCAKGTNALVATQILTFSAAVEKTCKTVLKLKGVEAVFTDTKEVKLSGANAGRPWGLATS
jgi:hypothetical protein